LTHVSTRTHIHDYDNDSGKKNKNILDDSFVFETQKEA